MRLIVVSTRLPQTVVRKDEELTLGRSAGGVATGVSDLIGSEAADRGSRHFRRDFPAEHLWVGWPGGVVLDGERLKLEKLLTPRRLVPVYLSAKEEELFYDGFSNRTVWPLFHLFPEMTRVEHQLFKGYEEVNRLFAAVVSAHYQPGDLIWVHDYHLMLLPALLRQLLPNSLIGYFHHIPFPGCSLFYSSCCYRTCHSL